MYKKFVIDFYKHIKKFDDFEYLVAILQAQIAPTSKNLKLGTMLNLRNGKRPTRYYFLLYKDSIKEKLDIDFCVLRSSDESVLVYFYKAKRLLKKLQEKKIINFLSPLGYEDCKKIGDYLEKLQERFTGACPDEIGIFLGYPLKDVIDFKNKDKKNCKCVGYWKCFNNIESSKKAFARYDKVKYEEIKKIVSSM